VSDSRIDWWPPIDGAPASSDFSGGGEPAPQHEPPRRSRARERERAALERSASRRGRIVAIVVCGLGYAEGARLSRRLGGSQVICWALVISLPVMAPLAWWLRPASLAAVGAASWWGLAYVSLFSMLIGFVFWYRGLALGGIAGVGQLQLLQPFFGFVLAALLLHETVPPAMIAVSVVVIACVAGARRFGRANGTSPARNRTQTQRV